MRTLTVIAVLLAAVAVGAATSAGTILHFSGDASAEPALPKPARAHARAVARKPTQAAARKAPSAERFARLLAGTSNQYGEEHSAPQRIRGTHCVQASVGEYMCSYAVERTGAPSECHLIQARWTPAAASSFTVTLSGRTARCGTLREAIDSLS